MTTLGSRQTWSAALSEVRTVTRSRSVPRSSQMTKVRWTPPSSRASSAGPAPGEVSTATLVWARQTLTARRRSRLWATTIWASSQGMPARAKAAATEETAGTTSTSRPCSGARRVRTTPKKPGSPSASTTAVPRCSAIRRAARLTLPSRIRSAFGGTSGSARWWAAPATRVAAPSAERAAAVSGGAVPSDHRDPVGHARQSPGAAVGTRAGSAGGLGRGAAAGRRKCRCGALVRAGRAGARQAESTPGGPDRSGGVGQFHSG